MPYPTPIVEIAFDDGPYVVSPTWTDVTSYVREFGTSRGVPDDWTLQADGSATVTLSNRDRRFDPFNTSGPYYGKLLPRRQIRIRATSGGTTYDVFRGFIAGWPPEWTDAGYDSTVTLSCFDALQLLGSSSMPADWAMPYIQSLNPRHYWEMDDPVNLFTSTLTLRDRGSAASGITGSTASVYQGNQIALGLPSHSIGTEQTLPLYQDPNTTSFALNAVSDFTISYWTIGTSATFINGWFTFYAFGGRGAVYIENRVNNPDYGRVFASFINAGHTHEWKSDVRIEPSEPHHIAITHTDSPDSVNMYVDGVQGYSIHSTGSGSVPGPYEGFGFSFGDFQQVALFPSVLTATQIQNIVRLGEGQFAENTSNRVARIIGQTPFSTSLVATPAVPAANVLSLTPDAPTASSELAKVSNSEYAPLFVNKAGTLTLYSQSQIRSQSSSIVSQVTYGSGGVPIGPDVQLQYDGDSMRNIANVEMSYGGVYIDENTTSVTTYGEAEQYVTTQVAAYSDAFQIGDIVTGWGGQVYPKASPISVVLSPNGSWGSTLALELFDRFTLAVAPRTGNVITTPMLLSRVSHRVTPERWTTTVEGSARWAAVWIWGQSTWGGTDLLG